MCETYIGREFEVLRGLIAGAQAEGRVHVVNPERLRCTIIALASAPFAAPAEFKALTGRSPFGDAQMRHSIEYIHRLLFKTN